MPRFKFKKKHCLKYDLLNEICLINGIHFLPYLTSKNKKRRRMNAQESAKN